MTHPLITDDALRMIWRDRGGSFHGPNTETGTMPEAKLLPFIRGLLLPETDRWVRCSERLPEHNDIVFFTDGVGGWFAGVFRRELGSFGGPGGFATLTRLKRMVKYTHQPRILAWMPAPQFTISPTDHAI